MPANEKQETSSNETSEAKDSADFRLFLEAERAKPPERAAAKIVWGEFIATLEKIVGSKDKQERFLSLHRGELKPTSTERAGSAAAFPADHAYNLFEKVKELDRAWYKRYAGRVLKFGGGAGVGAGVKWLVENFDPSWIGFGLAISIGYLAMDDFYDGGSIVSISVIGLLVAAMLQVPRDKPKR